MQLLLFDIDGTLIRSHSAGREAMAAALIEVFGTAGPIENYRMGGKTDSLIINDLLTAAGVNPNQIQANLSRLYQQMEAKARAIFPGKNILPCPGVPELLAALSRRDDIVLGLLTGNIESTAPLKLAAAGLDPSIFLVGAYGSDDMDRNNLLPVAMERAKQLTNRTFTGNNTVVIGDTPADILCARSGKATAVAVASGWHSADTLARYYPDYLFQNLVDTAGTVNILLGNHNQPGQ